MCKTEESVEGRRTRLWEWMKALEFSRPAGIPGENLAKKVILEKLRELGASPWEEAFPLNQYQVERASLEVLSGSGRSIPCRPAHFSGATPPEGITAPLLCIENASEAQLRDAPGKLLLYHGELGLEQYTRIVKSGAAGLLIFDGSVADDFDKVSIGHRTMRKRHLEAGVIPILLLRAADAVALAKEKPEALRLTLLARTVEGSGVNLLAEIPGTEAPEEVILLTAHYDSLPNTQGMCDNASGAVILLSLLQYFSEHPLRRTLRFLWTAAEEMGLLGSRAYVERHGEELEQVAMSVNVDMAGAVLGTNKAIVTAEEGLCGMLRYLAAEIGMPLEVTQDIYSSDSIPLADAGVPAVNFARFGAPGTLTIHNQCDRLEFLSPEELANMTGLTALFLERVAGCVNFPVPREIPAAVREKIDNYKQKRAY